MPKHYRKSNESRGTKNIPAKELKAQDTLKDNKDIDKYFKSPIGGGVKPISKVK